MLFPGDSVQDGDIYMFGPMREMHAYIHSLEKLEAMSTRFDHVHPSHGSLSVDKNIIPVLAMKARLCLEGKLEKTPVEVMGGMHVMRHDAGVAGFLMAD